MQAVRLRNKLALKKLVQPEMAAQLDSPEGAQMMKMMAAFMSPKLRVVAVTETGDSAEAIAMAGGKGSRESSSFKLTRINGEWKIAKP